MKNKILAKAKPNELYRWFNCVKNITLEAELTKAGRILFFENYNNNRKQISEKLVDSLFLKGKSLTHQPFTISENKVFYTILKRKKKKYSKDFKKLTQD